MIDPRSLCAAAEANFDARMPLTPIPDPDFACP